MFSFESHLAFSWKMQTLRTMKNSRGRHNHNQNKQKKNLGITSSARKSRAWNQKMSHSQVGTKIFRMYLGNCQ